MIKEAQIHTHSEITDKFEKYNLLAYEEVFCDICNKIVHCCNNECIRTWIEIENGNFCLDCFCENPEKIIKGFLKRDEDINEDTCDIKKQAEDFYSEGRRYLQQKESWYIIP